MRRPIGFSSSATVWSTSRSAICRRWTRERSGRRAPEASSDARRRATSKRMGSGTTSSTRPSRRAVDRRHDRLALPQLLEPRHRLLTAARERFRLLPHLHPLEHLHVGPGDESVRLAAGQDQRGDRRIVRGAPQEQFQLVLEIRPERVDWLAGDVHPHHADAVARRLQPESLRGHVYSRVRMQAPPRPPAAQMETRAVPSPRADISRRAWCTSRAPVAPKGCPSAMDPPFGLIFSAGGSPIGSAPPRCSSANFFDPQACRLERTWAEKASWISNRSMSGTRMPARRSTSGTAKAGACSSCQAGSTAAYAYSLRKPSGFIPSARAFSSAITTSAAAPSVSGDELPAVTDPYLRSKTGLSFA